MCHAPHFLQVFRKLDGMKTGLVDVEVFHRFFTTSQHPSVLGGLQSPEGVWSSLSDCLQPVGRGTTISYAVSVWGVYVWVCLPRDFYHTVGL